MNKKNESMFAFSVDVEDWYNCSRELFNTLDSVKVPRPDESVICNTRLCMDALESSGSKATFFVLTSICQYYPDLVKEIECLGHEVAIHTYSHRLLYKMTMEEFIADLEKSLELMHRCGIEKVDGFRAPYWSITEKSLWVLDILKEYDFVYDSSIFPIHRKLYGIPGAPVSPYVTSSGMVEMPPATTKLMGFNLPIAGGGYLRFTPEYLFRLLVNRERRENKPGIFYCHSYEMDPLDVKMPDSITGLTSFLYRMQQKYGRNKSPRKLTNPWCPVNSACRTRDSA